MLFYWLWLSIHFNVAHGGDFILFFKHIHNISYSTENVFGKFYSIAHTKQFNVFLK